MTQRREKLTVTPIAHAQGTVTLPGSKSISNRALLLAALSEGTTRLTGLLKADDTDRMIDSLRNLGIEIVRESDDCAVIKGCGGMIPNRQAQIFVGNAGTVARTLSAVLAFAGGNYRMDGVERMRERPIADLVDALRMLGAHIEYGIKEGYPPLVFHPAKSIADSVKVKGNVSSQFLTAVLLVSPLLAKTRALAVEIEGELISKPYVEMTVRMMAVFGVRVEKTETGFHVAAGQSYKTPGDYRVEADASGASYFL
ncbi:MAG: 3-phosphoshikimate 1-carboxyvinyltransferase, partial [Sutterellaceae bacterium]|nr:3-phosphoshikimate 1-carboxyvinyltransferase [Sutterellaceae bacterium]